MGKRLILSGADFSLNAVSFEKILNLLEVAAIEQLGSVALNSISEGEYYFNRGSGDLGVKVNNTIENVTSKLTQYDGLKFMGIALTSDGARYNVAYPENFEKIVFSDSFRYDYNSSTGAVTENTATSGFYGGYAEMKKGDILVFSGNGGTLPRGIVVKTPDKSSVLYVSEPGDPATNYAPFFFEATENCVVYMNSSKTHESYMKRK